jgi:hypothetical protein
MCNNLAKQSTINIQCLADNQHSAQHSIYNNNQTILKVNVELDNQQSARH